MASAPTVMVSSTFYNLRQIRSDLARFISDELGYVPLLSELPSFPVDPDVDTIANCRARVENEADILVLIIGGRYGSIDKKTEKSMTNLEFLAARQKGIPIYSFAEKAILAVMPIWKDNPMGDFSSAVETPKLFEFVDYVQSQERVWTFSFETAQDIITVLRLQFAYLLYDSLRLRLRMAATGTPKYLQSLGPSSLRIALERSGGWEYRLFFESLIEEVERRNDLIKEFRTGLTVEPAEWVTALDASDWLQTRLHELQGLVDSANRLVSSYATEAFGMPGEAGSAEDIVWASHMLGVALENTLKWARRIRCARLQVPFDSLNSELALFVDDLITQFRAFPNDSLERVDEALASTETVEPQPLTLTFPLRLSNVERFNEAVEAARPRYLP